MAMDYFAFLPGAIDPKQNPMYHDKSGFFIAPAGPKGSLHQHRWAGDVNLLLLKEHGYRQTVHEVVYAETGPGKMGDTWWIHAA